MELESAVTAATAAFADLDLVGFEAARDEAFRALPCLGEALTPAAAAGYHRVIAMDAFVAQDAAATEAAFAALLSAYPAWRLPSSVAPRGHPLRTAFEAAEARPSSGVVGLPVPLEATLLVDGRHTLDYPTDRPSVLQLLDAAGAVSWTTFHAAGEPAPDYVAAPEDARAAYLEQAVILAPTRRKPVELVITAAGLAVGSAALWATAAGQERQFTDPTTPYGDLGALQARTNTLLVGAAALGAGAAATGAVAVVRW